MAEFTFPASVTFDPPPAVVYKFRQFPNSAGLTGDARAAADRTRATVVDAVCNGRLYLSHPSSFSDPFDCYVNVVPRFSDAEEQKQAAIRKLKSYRAAVPAAVRRKHLYNPEILEKKADKLTEVMQGSFQSLRDEARVYSVAGNRDRPLLWAHYADGHRGVCLHIDTSRPPFSVAYKVEYQSEVGTVPAPYYPENKVEREWAVKQLLCVKDKDWSYEDESRFVPDVTPEVIELLAHFGSNVTGAVLTMPRERVIGLSVGARMDETTLQELLTAIACRGEDFPVFRAIRSKDRFDITFESIR